jgi:hypothetical protein
MSVPMFLQCLIEDTFNHRLGCVDAVFLTTYDVGFYFFRTFA